MNALASNFSFIIDHPDMIVTLMSSGILGVICFFVALRLTETNQIEYRYLKYLLTTCSISFVSVFFILLLSPIYFQEVSSYYIVTKCLSFIGIWIVITEAIHLYVYVRKRIKGNNGKICQEITCSKAEVCPKKWN